MGNVNPTSQPKSPNSFINLVAPPLDRESSCLEGKVGFLELFKEYEIGDVSDANWIFDIKDSRSTSGYVNTLGGAAIYWKYSKQSIIAMSTMESEFSALDKMRRRGGDASQIYVEDITNVGLTGYRHWLYIVIVISTIGKKLINMMYNGKSIYIRHRHNSIRQLLSTGVISIDYVKSKDNIVDPFMKGLIS
ncbi:hypothetical protein Tco_0381137 [Tanacetum coccineum]